ncbi:MAG: Sapep family Mn(2+)-dependent dipeptidase [Candidatus Sumerlaeaceae bacterium]
MPDSELKQRIEEQVNARRDEIVASLVSLLKFRTISGAPDEPGQKTYKNEIGKCLKHLEAESQRLGLEWRNHDNVVALAEVKAGENFIGLPVHIDVVPPGDGWSHGAFEGAIVDGVIYGRGCQDDKGPVVQMLYAASLLKELGIDLKRGARVVIGTTEEFGEWYDIKKYFELEAAPDLSIVSDAGFPIINGEKGMMNLKMSASIARDEEPNVGGFRFLSAMGGERANIVPPKAELIFEGDPDSDAAQLQRELERFLEKHPEAKAEMSARASNQSILFHGKGAHGSTPQEGHNAALDMLLFMTQSGFVSDDEADMAQFLLDCGGDLEGGKLDIAHKHDFIGPTTVNLGILNWNAGEVQATFNIRNSMGLSVADAISRASKVFEDFGEETGFEVSAETVSKTMEPIYVDPNEHPEFIAVLKEAYTTFTGREATLHAIGGTTYAKVFPNAVCFGPVDLAEEKELAHQADERISIEHLLRNVKIYTYAIARLCAA